MAIVSDALESGLLGEQAVGGLSERQSRIESALVQIAGHVDDLEKGLQDEQEVSTKLLSALVVSGPSAAATAAPEN